MNSSVQRSALPQKRERCYNRCGQTFSVSSQRSIQPLISRINTPVPSLPSLPPHPTLPQSSVTSCYIWPSTSPRSPVSLHPRLCLPLSLPCCCCSLTHRTSFCLVFSPPCSSLPLPPLLLLLPLFLFARSFSLQRSLTQIYISSAVIDIFHLPASFPIGCQPASPRQLR